MIKLKLGILVSGGAMVHIHITCLPSILCSSETCPYICKPEKFRATPQMAVITQTPSPYEA